MRATSCFLSLAVGLSLTCTANAASTPLDDIVVSDPQTNSSGHWNYKLSRSASAWPCADVAGGATCVEQVLTVVNESSETLECKLRVEYRNAGGKVVRSFEGPALVLPKSKPVIHSLTTDATLTASVQGVDCIARSSYQRIAKPAGCKYDMFGKPFESYYPADAMQRSLQGPVIVSFVLRSPNGVAKDIAIAQTSLVPTLDEAARQFISDQMFSTNCPGQRFDIQMRFKLRDQVLADTH